MHILLTNDDGIFAPGLAAIYKQLIEIGDVTVVAPAKSKSGASHSISLKPLACEKVEIIGKFTGYSVEGSPADCVKLAVMELIKKPAPPIDLVVSGINCGANVGINIYYSGTVAAATEAAFYSIPSVALSAAFEENINFQSAAEHGAEIIKKLLPLNAGDIINVNIPWLSKDNPKGVRVVQQSINGFDENYTTKNNDNGQTVYQLNGGVHRDDKSAQTDTTLLVNGFITVTALHFDMTDHKKNSELENIQW